jgi:hypothetical protein
MGPDSKRYLLGSIVSVYVKNDAEIIGMTSDKVEVKYPDGKTEFVLWYHIRPINLGPDYMRQIGFSLMKKIEHPHHMEYCMDIKINGKFYTARGIVLKDRSIWSFNNVSIRYLHQVQSLVWIIEPNYTFDIFKNKQD